MKQTLKIIICITLILGIMVSSSPMSLAAAKTNMPNKVTISYTTNLKALATKLLSDIKGHWAEKTIQALFDKGIISGTNGKYQPQKNISRAEFVVMLVKVMGYKESKNTKYSFTDTSKHWAKTAIETAVENKLILVSEWGKSFKPNSNITREQMAVMMARALKIDFSYNSNPFYEKSINPLIIKAYELGLISGSTSNGKLYFNPKNTATKAEAAVTVFNALQYKENPSKFIEQEHKIEAWKNTFDQRVSKELQKNKTGLEGGNTVQESNEYALKDMGNWTAWMKDSNITNIEDFKKEFLRVAKAHINAWYNKSYEKLDILEKGMKETWAPINVENYLSKNLQKVKENKIVTEGDFFTGEGLIFISDQRPVLRGTLQYRYLKPTSIEILKKDICGETGEPADYDTWYEEDIEITFFPEDGLKVNKINHLSETRLATLVR